MTSLTRIDSSIESFLGPFAPIYTTLVDVACQNDEKFREERSQQMLEWLADHNRALSQVLKGLADLRVSVDQVNRLVTDPQFHGIRWNYKVEASREATHERRLMLAYAAAETLEPTMTIAQLARVERTIRELDPDDLRVLAELDSTTTSIPPVPQGVDVQEFTKKWMADHQEQATRRVLCWRNTQPSGHILAAAGCLYIQEMSWHLTPAPSMPHHTEMITVTDLGNWVLRVTELYRRTRQKVSSGS